MPTTTVPPGLPRSCAALPLGEATSLAIAPLDNPSAANPLMKPRRPMCRAAKRWRSDSIAAVWSIRSIVFLRFVSMRRETNSSRAFRTIGDAVAAGAILLRDSVLRRLAADIERRERHHPGAGDHIRDPDVLVRFIRSFVPAAGRA